MGSIMWLILAFSALSSVIQCQDVIMDPTSSYVFLEPNQSYKKTCTSKFQQNQNLTLTWTAPEGSSPSINKAIILNSLPSTLSELKAELEITKYNDKMSGRYNCELRNKTDYDRLLHEYPVQFYTVEKEGEDVMFYRENTTISLSCKIKVKDAKIDPPVWKKGNKLISEVQTEGSKLKADGSKLTIENVMRSDAALYTAEYPVEIDGNSLYYNCEVAIKAEPLVLDFAKSKNIVEENDLDLQCKVLGYPTPVVTWYKGNELLTDSTMERISMEDSEGVVNATLKVKNAVFDDAGTYKCLATIEELHANNSKTIVIRVKDRYAALWPFLGIVGEVIALCAVIFFCERRKKSKRADQGNPAVVDTDGAATEQSEGLRHRNTANNPRA